MNFIKKKKNLLIRNKNWVVAFLLFFILFNLPFEARSETNPRLQNIINLYNSTYHGNYTSFPKDQLPTLYTVLNRSGNGSNISQAELDKIQNELSGAFNGDPASTSQTYTTPDGHTITTIKGNGGPDTIIDVNNKDGTKTIQTTDGKTRFYDKNGNDITAQTDQQAQSPQFQNQPKDDCGWICLAVTSGIMHTVGWFYGSIGEIILRVFSLLLIVAATLFNMVVQITVISMSVSVKNLQAINVGWATFRDLANILFIFVLLYIAIATILQLESVNTKKMLTNIVIVALLINFSLFFTKVIIDASNILSAQFYNAISIKGQPLSHTDITGAIGTSGLSLLVNKTGADNGISDAIMSSMDLVTIFDFKKNPQTLAGTVGGVMGELMTISVATLAGSIFILIAACIFLASGILFVVRFVVLIFLLMTSPLAYVGMILPATKQYSQKWWDALIKECIFAPVYFLMIWATIKIMGSGGLKAIIPAGGTFSDLAAGGIGAVSVVLNFVVVSALMVASLLISRNLGAKGGQAAFGAFDTIRKAGQGLIGRNTIGEIGRGAEDKLKRTQWANNPFFDALRSGTTRKLADMKYGSGSSRQEAYLHNQHLRSEKETARKGDTVRKIVTELDQLEKEIEGNEKAREDTERDFSSGLITKKDWLHRKRMNRTEKMNLDKRQRATTKRGQQETNRMTPAEFAQAFDKQEYMNGNLTNLATYDQVHAAREKREDMNDEERELLAKGRFDRPIKRKLATYKKELEIARTRVYEDSIAKGRTHKEAMADAQMAERTVKKNSRAFKDMHRYARAMTEGELELLHEVEPEVFRDRRFMPSVRFLKIKALQNKGSITPAEADDIRFAKASDLDAAADTGLGRNIRAYMGDHAPSELAGHKSDTRLDPRKVRYYDANTLSQFISSDKSDQGELGEAYAWDINNAMKAAESGGKGQITHQTYSAWDWLYNDFNNEGQKMLSTMKGQGVNMPAFDKAKIDRLRQSGNLEIVDEIGGEDKRKRGDSTNW